MLLADAVRYLERQNTKRPLWKGQRQTKGGLEEPPHPLYPALSNSRTSFKSTLSAQYQKWHKRETKSPREALDYPEEFLDYFARRLNIPNVPLRYCLLTNSDIPSNTINKRIPNGVKAIEEKIGPIGIAVLGKNGEETIAFPIAFLESLQDAIRKDSFLKEGDLIKNALRDYIQYLDALEITESCIGVSSLELKNLRDFLVHKDNLIASAGQ